MEVGKYCKSWWAWWCNLQPRWRVKAKGKGKKGLLSLDVDGLVMPPNAWKDLLHPGANGIIVVVATLYWWGYTVATLKGKKKEEEVRNWMEALSDCRAVMECLISELKGRGNEMVKVKDEDILDEEVAEDVKGDQC